MSKWGCGETIGLIIGIAGVLIAIAGFTSPEIRCFVGLHSDEYCPSGFFVKGFFASEVGVDYNNVYQSLSDRDFQNADQQTTAKIFEVLSHATERDINETSLTVEDINNFPCKDLRTIDQMWVNHSNGKFGLSVQKNIWTQLGGTGKFDVKIYNRFTEKVGWKQEGDNWYGYEQLQFDPRAPAGHLPVYFNLPYWLWKQASNRVEWDKDSAVAAFFSRVSFCER